MSRRSARIATTIFRRGKLSLAAWLKATFPGIWVKLNDERTLLSEVL